MGSESGEALKNSGWLIVICSSETKDSPWVNLEIKTFLEFHDRSRILAVVTEGEPEDVFQKELLGSDRTAEVLAADARGETPEQVLRNVKKNVLLKIAAPILGTTYDSLKQRQRNYIIKKYAVIGSLAVLMANAFFPVCHGQKTTGSKNRTGGSWKTGRRIRWLCLRNF